MRQCWHPRCTAPECDGEDHISADGRAWREQPRVIVRQAFVVQRFDGLDWEDVEPPASQGDATILAQLYREEFPAGEFRVISRYRDTILA